MHDVGRRRWERCHALHLARIHLLLRLHFLWLILDASVRHRFHRHIRADLLWLKIRHGSRELELLNDFHLELHVVDGCVVSGGGDLRGRWKNVVVLQVVHRRSFHLLRLGLKK